MTRHQARRLIREFGAAGNVILTKHVRERMALRKIQIEDLLHALANTNTCVQSPDGPNRWKTAGPDLGATATITCVVALSDDCVVITTY